MIIPEVLLKHNGTMELWPRRTFPSLTFLFLRSAFAGSLTLDIPVSQCLPSPSLYFLCQYTLTTQRLAIITKKWYSTYSLYFLLPGKDSPSSKLLFAKDIPLYRQLVLSFYQNIQTMPQVCNNNEGGDKNVWYLYRDNPYNWSCIVIS